VTYGIAPSGTSEKKVREPMSFVLPRGVDWPKAIAPEPRESTFLLSGVVSASATACSGVISVWQQPGLSLMYASELQFVLLEQTYRFRRRDEVISFLKAYPFLVSLLVEAYPRIAQCFGPHPLVFLEVVTDPEAADDRQLVAFTRTDLVPIKALASLDRFDKSWWLEASHRSRGKLCVHLE